MAVLEDLFKLNIRCKFEQLLLVLSVIIRLKMSSLLWHKLEKVRELFQVLYADILTKSHRSEGDTVPLTFCLKLDETIRILTRLL